MANFGRIISGYKQSLYSYNDPPFKDGILKANNEEPTAVRGIEPPEWHHWNRPRAHEWMGSEWFDPCQLEDRLTATPPNNGLYRIWYEDSNAPLAYMGESSIIPFRFYTHEKTFGGQALFAYVERSDLDAAHQHKEIETDLLGAYYLAIGETLSAQFDHSERVPPKGTHE